MTFGPIHIDHIGIATNNLDEASLFWNLIGLAMADNDETVADQGVTTRFFSTSSLQGEPDHPPMVELLEPTGPNTPIGRFLTNEDQVFNKYAFESVISKG